VAQHLQLRRGRAWQNRRRQGNPGGDARFLCLRRCHVTKPI